MTCANYEVFFKNLSNKLRISIIEILLDSEKNVSEICEILGEEQSKVSHNLKILLNCNFIEQKISGKNRIYFVNKNTIKPLFEIVKKHVEMNCCSGCCKKTKIKN